MKERVHWIDIAKGIAILCVFFGHTVSTPSLLVKFVYLFHMPVFFMLSGYVFSNKRNFKDFLLVKLKTVVLPIFTIGLAGAVLVGAVFQVVKHEDPGWKWLFLNPIVQYGTHSLLWYLAALFVLLLIFYGLTKLFKDRVKLLIPVSFLLGLVSYCFIRFVGITLPWSIDTALVALPFTAIGYGIKKADISQKIKHPAVLIVAAALCIAAGYFNYSYFGSIDMHTNAYGNIFLFYIGAVSGSIMVISLSMLINKNAPLEYFGKNSLIFYAFEPAQYFINFLLKTTGFASGGGRSLIVMLAVTLAAVAAITLINCLLSLEINQFAPFLIGKTKEKQA